MGLNQRIKSQRISKYQWPATQLDTSDMAILHAWRSKTGTPIDHLLAQAVREMQKIILRG